MLKPFLPIIAALLLASPAKAASVDFLKTTFDLADITVAPFGGSGQIASTPSGEGLQVTTVTSAVTHNGFLFGGLTLDLAAQRLESLTWIVEISRVNSFGEGMAFGLLLEQDGAFYVGDIGITGSGSSQQTRGAVGLEPADFSLFDGSGGLSFARGAAPITFGLYTGNDRGNGISFIYDDFTVSAQVAPVPLPAGLGLLAASLGGLGFGALRRRAAR